MGITKSMGNLSSDSKFATVFIESAIETLVRSEVTSKLTNASPELRLKIMIGIIIRDGMGVFPAFP